MTTPDHHQLKFGENDMPLHVASVMEPVDELYARLESQLITHIPPPAKLLQSVKLLGVLEPIIIANNAGKATLCAGRRRLQAAKLAGLKEIPVRYVSIKNDFTALAIQSDENNARSPNPLSDLEVYNRAVIECQANNIEPSDKTVARLTGLPVATVRRIKKWHTLPQPVMKAIVEGRITAHVAEKLATLPAKAIEQACELLSAEKGIYTSQHLKQALTARSVATFSAMPLDAIFATPQAQNEYTHSALIDQDGTILSVKHIERHAAPTVDTPVLLNECLDMLERLAYWYTLYDSVQADGAIAESDKADFDFPYLEVDRLIEKIKEVTSAAKQPAS